MIVLAPSWVEDEIPVLCPMFPAVSKDGPESLVRVVRLIPEIRRGIDLFWVEAAQHSQVKALACPLLRPTAKKYLAEASGSRIGGLKLNTRRRTTWQVYPCLSSCRLPLWIPPHA
jgi:hypothetical protein